MIMIRNYCEFLVILFCQCESVFLSDHPLVLQVEFVATENNVRGFGVGMSLELGHPVGDFHEARKDYCSSYAPCFIHNMSNTLNDCV